MAPDHPNIKAVSRVYEKTAAHPEFRFYGNLEYGRDLDHDDLTSRYHAIVYAVGAQTDKQIGAASAASSESGIRARYCARTTARVASTPCVVYPELSCRAQ